MCKTNETCAAGEYCKCKGDCTGIIPGEYSSYFNDAECLSTADVINCQDAQFQWGGYINGSIAITGAPCKCSTSRSENTNNCEVGKYCHADETCRSYPQNLTACWSSDEPNRGNYNLTQSCMCGSKNTGYTECDAGQFCNSLNACSDVAETIDCHTDQGNGVIGGKVVISGTACKCSNTGTANNCAVGKYCHVDKTCASYPQNLTACWSSDEPTWKMSVSNLSTPCYCGTTRCEAGQYCNGNAAASVCSNSGFDNDCATESTRIPITGAACKCGDGSSATCALGMYCHTDKTCTNTSETIACVAPAGVEKALFMLPLPCKCGAAAVTNDCAAGSYCYLDGTCRSTPQRASWIKLDISSYFDGYSSLGIAPLLDSSSASLAVGDLDNGKANATLLPKGECLFV